MAQRSHVPKFGNWESEDNVPYTVFFDKARKGRGGGMINPNDPQDNPDAFRGNGSPAPAPAPASALAPARAPASRTRTEKEESIGRGVVRPDHERRTGREEGFADSPGRNENLSRRASNGPGEPQRKPVRPSVGSEYSVERSPLHPQQARMAAGRGNNSPSWESKNPNEGMHGTPGRTRMKPPGRDNYPDKGPTVPRFGDWDETNPSSADGYTQVFNKVREEKQTGSVRVPGMGGESAYNTGKPVNDDKPKRCCFPWG